MKCGNKHVIKPVYPKQQYLIDIKEFDADRKSVIGDPWSGRSSTFFKKSIESEIKAWSSLFCNKGHYSKSSYFGSIQAILKNGLGLQHVASQFVLKTLNLF